MKKTNPKLNVLSLFSGCGGMDLGFEGDFNVLSKSVNTKINTSWKVTPVDDAWVHLGKTNFNTVFANDIRQDAKVAWTNYFATKGLCRTIYHLDSIVDLVKQQRQLNNNVFPKNVDIVTGGFPCQDFSIAGKRKGFSSVKSHDGKAVIADEHPSTENRGQLYMWMRDVISITTPKVFIAENVKGLTSLKDVKDIIEKDFASINSEGYLVVPAQVLHAADYGVPQSRERVIFLGFKKSALTEQAKLELSKPNIPDKFNPYPVVTHAFTTEQISLFSNNDLLSPVTVRDALTGLEEPRESDDLSQQSYSKAKFMGKHCQGQTEVNLDGISPTIRSEHHGNIEYRRLSLEHGGKYVSEFERGYSERRLTIRECARIQTFPDNYEFVIKKTQTTEALSASNSYKLIGNAVPPLLAYHIAKRLEDNWSLYFK